VRSSKVKSYPRKRPSPNLADAPFGVKHYTFRIVDLSRAFRHGSELLQIKFDNTHPVPRNQPTYVSPIQSGVLLLDPNKNWCLRYGEVQLTFAEGDGIVRIDSDLSESGRKYPIPRRVVYEIEVKNQRAIHETTFQLREPLQRIPDEEFTLSAF